MVWYAVFTAAVFWAVLRLLHRPGLVRDRDALTTTTGRQGTPELPPEVERGLERLRSLNDPDVRAHLRSFGIPEEWFTLGRGALLVGLLLLAMPFRTAPWPLSGLPIFAGVLGLFGPPYAVRAAGYLRRLAIERDLPVFLLLLGVYLEQLPLVEAVKVLAQQTPPGILRRLIWRLSVEAERLEPAAALERFRDRLGIPAAEGIVSGLLRAYADRADPEVFGRIGAKIDELQDAAIQARSKAMPHLLTAAQAMGLVAALLVFALPLATLVAKSLGGLTGAMLP